MSGLRPNRYRKLKRKEIEAAIKTGELVDGLKIIKLDYIMGDDRHSKDEITFICKCGKEKKVLVTTFRLIKSCGCYKFKPRPKTDKHHMKQAIINSYIKEKRILSNLNCIIISTNLDKNSAIVECTICLRRYPINVNYHSGAHRYDIFTRKTSPCDCAEGNKLVGTKYGCLEVSKFIEQKKARKIFEIKCTRCGDKTIRSNQSFYMMKKFPAHFCSKCPDKREILCTLLSSQYLRSS